MATTKSGSKPPAYVSWWKHLRPYGKRGAAKKARQDGKKACES